MKTVKNIWSNVQKTDLVNIKGVDYVVVKTDAKGNRTNSHITVKKI